MSLETRLEGMRRAHPGVFLLDPEDLPGLEKHLRTAAILSADETIEDLERAGQGNMNCTLRITTSHRRLIVKQSRPWVEKYPQFDAPWDRALREIEFYRRVQAVPRVRELMPGLVGADADSRLLVLEDLGRGGDYTDLYHGARLQEAELDILARFLSSLHGASTNGPAGAGFANREMRSLNHAHIFDIPFRADNGLDLDSIRPGLAVAARPVKEDPALVAAVRKLGEEGYLADGPSLLHGDFFPGSLVRTPAGPRVIDPEFGFLGAAEFDAGVFAAHLILSGHPAATVRLWETLYSPPAAFRPDLARQFAGAEILRRLIGYAQLPLTAGLDAFQRWLELGRRLVLRPAEGYNEPS